MSSEKSNLINRCIASSYYVSKLIQILMTRGLAERLCGPSAGPDLAKESQDVIVNTLTPGYCYSSLLANAHSVTGFGFWVLAMATARTTEVGARCLVLSISKGLESHGKYINDGKVDE
jgi:retinol dehydrogenase-12